MSRDPALELKLASWQRRAAIVGAAGMATSVVGFFIDVQQFHASYLLAFIYWVNISLGCLGILMLHHMVSGGWGFVVQRLAEAGARTMPLFVLLFLPIVIGLPILYPWARESAGPVLDHIIHLKSGYLNVPFFIGRAAAYFVIWTGAAYVLSHWSRRQDASADHSLTRKIRLLSAPGLILFVFTVTFASVDWGMSLEPEWFSSIYGFLFVTSQLLATFAFMIVMLRIVAPYQPIAGVVTPRHYHHIGNLLFAFVILWAYMSYSQLAIIWLGNLPEEIGWYRRRLGVEWNIVALILLILHFFVPFLVLLSRRVKQTLRTLSIIAVVILIMRAVDIFWLLRPAFQPAAVYVHWMDISLLAGIGGVWLMFFLRQLRGSSLLPLHDPRFEPLLVKVHS